MPYTYEWDSLLTLQQLRAVVAVAQVGSFSGAARMLRMSQPTVSRAVSAVESLVGAQLFTRTTRRTGVTRAGEEFVVRAERALSEIHAAAEGARRPGDAAARHLSVGCLMSIAHGYLAATLLRLQPTGGVRCVEAMQVEIEADVLARRVDIGVADVDVLRPGLSARPLWSEHAHACLPASHPLGGERLVSLEQLVDEDIVAFPRQSRLRAQLDRALAASGPLRPPRFVVQHYATQFSLVAAGLGIGVVPACVVPSAPQGLAFPRLREASMGRIVGGLWPTGSPPSPSADRFLNALTELVTANPFVAQARQPRATRPR